MRACAVTVGRRDSAPRCCANETLSGEVRARPSNRLRLKRPSTAVPANGPPQIGVPRGWAPTQPIAFAGVIQHRAEQRRASLCAFGESKYHGEEKKTKIFAQCQFGRRERDATLQARHCQKRQRREGRQGEEPQAGHRHRSIGSAQEGQKGSEEGRVAVGSPCAGLPAMPREPFRRNSRS